MRSARRRPPQAICAAFLQVGLRPVRGISAAQRLRGRQLRAKTGHSRAARPRKNVGAGPRDADGPSGDPGFLTRDRCPPQREPTLWRIIVERATMASPRAFSRSGERAWRRASRGRPSLRSSSPSRIAPFRFPGRRRDSWASESRGEWSKDNGHDGVASALRHGPTDGCDHLLSRCGEGF